MSNVREKLALVTGGSRGIGRAAALRLAGEGSHLAITYNTAAEKAAEVVQQAEALGVRAKAYPIDLSQRDRYEPFVAQVVQDFGMPVQVLVNNAGTLRDEPLSVLSYEAWGHTLAVDLEAPVFLAKAAVPGMKKAKWGRIINISSLVGVHGASGQVAYAAAKGGLIAVTKSLALELACKNPSDSKRWWDITVNCVCPGFIKTDMMESVGPVINAAILEQSPMRRMGTPEEVAEAIAHFACGASYSTGVVYEVNGGLRT